MSETILTSATMKPKRRERRQVTVDIPEGKFAVYKDRGYDKAMHDRILNDYEWVVAQVRQREVVTINGVRFYVEGAEDGFDVQAVLLPKPIADVLRNADEMHRSADREWAERTARSLGGRMADEIRG